MLNGCSWQRSLFSARGGELFDFLTNSVRLSLKKTRLSYYWLLIVMLLCIIILQTDNATVTECSRAHACTWSHSQGSEGRHAHPYTPTNKPHPLCIYSQPENILLDSNGSVKVSDFGFSVKVKESDELTGGEYCTVIVGYTVYRVIFAWFYFRECSKKTRKLKLLNKRMYMVMYTVYYYQFAKIRIANTLFCTLSRKLNHARYTVR